MIEQSVKRLSVLQSILGTKIEGTIYLRLPIQEINGIIFTRNDMLIPIFRATGRKGEIKYLSFFYG